MWPSASVLSCSESDGNDRGVRITDRGTSSSGCLDVLAREETGCESDAARSDGVG